MHHTTTTRNIRGILLDGLKPGGRSAHRDVHFLPYHEADPAFEYDARKGEVSIFPNVPKLFEKHAVYSSSIGTILICETISTECFARVEVFNSEEAQKGVRVVWSAGVGLPLEFLKEPGQYSPKILCHARRWALKGGAYCSRCSAGFVPHTIECLYCGLVFEMPTRGDDPGIDTTADHGPWPSVTYPNPVPLSGTDIADAGHYSSGAGPSVGVGAVPDYDALATPADFGEEAPCRRG